jgi:hypothetical protein
VAGILRLGHYRSDRRPVASWAGLDNASFGALFVVVAGNMAGTLSRREEE